MGGVASWALGGMDAPGSKYKPTLTLVFRSGAASRRIKIFTASGGALDKKFAGGPKFVVTPLHIQYGGRKNGSAHNSGCILDRTEMSKVIIMFLGTANSMSCRPTLDVLLVVWKSKMAASKQEVVIALVVL